MSAAVPLPRDWAALVGAIAQLTGLPEDDVRPESRVVTDLKLDSLGLVELIAVLDETGGGTWERAERVSIWDNITLADLIALGRRA